MSESNRIDYNQIDYPGAGMELLANAAREAINPVIKRSNEFEAKVITQVVDVPADFESDGYKKSINPNPKDTDKKYKFYAKVIGKQPQKFLAEGCEDDPSYSKEKRDQINTLNTQLCQVITNHPERPKQGDIIKITLEPGLDYEFNCRRAKSYLGIVRSTSETDLKTLNQEQKEVCDSMENLFKSVSFTSVGNINTSYEKHFEPSIGPLLNPLSGYPVLNNFYNKRSRGIHGGLDLGAEVETPVRAMHDGTVSIRVSSCKDNHPNLKTIDGKLVAISEKDCGRQPDGTLKGSLGGNLIRVTHPDGWFTSYMHLSGKDLTAKSGVFVKAGDIIAYSGNTGNSSGPHLHLQLHRSNGRLLNPAWHIGESAHAAATAAREAELSSAVVESAPAAPEETSKHS